MRRRERESDLVENVIHINRVAKVVKGGRRFSFSALVAVGDQKGNVGISIAKANEVAEAIRKAFDRAKRNMVKVPDRERHASRTRSSGSGAPGCVLMRPAAPGTGVIAGGPVRAVLEAAGVTDVLTKSLGTNNPINVVRATMDGLDRAGDRRAGRRGARASRSKPWECIAWLRSAEAAPHHAGPERHRPPGQAPPHACVRSGSSVINRVSSTTTRRPSGA